MFIYNILIIITTFVHQYEIVMFNSCLWREQMLNLLTVKFNLDRPMDHHRDISNKPINVKQDCILTVTIVTMV